ncbi:sugar transferase [Maribellus comscasis]|uniref:Sugar transferase n=1 Tax=Maribellus comscasis TaxID=2681766 RepID=A0A6I6JZI5_9BACT|nr:sugar transferase [Maribellus comscasis]QGY46578.1 sugar transferase [Maribellus comscasis]
MYRYFFKRVIDVVLSLTAILILLPFWIPICIILLVTGEHEVFYFQQRIGYKNKPFYIWKHATMMKASETMKGGLHTTRNDPRVLPFGKFLRKTKINELPQLINIFKGDMSIIGPRPLVDKTFTPYPKHVQENIYNVKPGLTGIGSIIFRDEEHLLSETSMDPKEFYAKHISPYKGELELWYQKNLSFRTDLKLVFCTAWVILVPDSELPYKIFKGLPLKPEALNMKNIVFEKQKDGITFESE